MSVHYRFLVRTLIEWRSVGDNVRKVIDGGFPQETCVTADLELCEPPMR